MRGGAPSFCVPSHLIFSRSWRRPPRFLFGLKRDRATHAASRAESRQLTGGAWQAPARIRLMRVGGCTRLGFSGAGESLCGGGPGLDVATGGAALSAADWTAWALWGWGWPRKGSLRAAVCFMGGQLGQARSCVETRLVIQ
jgi:hypothetical protein